MPTSPSAVRGVIFDMDGVLCDSEPFICEAACRMFHETHRVAVRPEDFVPFVGMGENRYLGGVAEKHGIRLDIERVTLHASASSDGIPSGVPVSTARSTSGSIPARSAIETPSCVHGPQSSCLTAVMPAAASASGGTSLRGVPSAAAPADIHPPPGGGPGPFRGSWRWGPTLP